MAILASWRFKNFRLGLDRHGIDPLPLMTDFTGAESLTRDDRISVLRTLQELHA